MSALSGIEIYDIRASRAWNQLYYEVFCTFNKGDQLTLIGGGCLDAPDQIPSGSMKNYGKNEPWIVQSLISRDIQGDADDKARQILAKRLIEEICLQTAVHDV